jgi:hypothetical protein
MNTRKTGIELMADERARHLTEEGWTDDSRYTRNELAYAAMAYTAPPDSLFRTYADPPVVWPFAEEWWKPGNRKRELVKAGALIAAELDRLLALE